MLLEEGIRRASGAKAVVVRFAAENRAARNFYESRAFEHVGLPSRMVEMKHPLPPRRV